jgi:hypothetical protein
MGAPYQGTARKARLIVIGLALAFAGIALLQMSDVPAQQRGRYWALFGLAVLSTSILGWIGEVVLSRPAFRLRLERRRRGSGPRSRGWTITAALYGAGVAGLLRLAPPTAIALVLGVTCGLLLVLGAGASWLLIHDANIDEPT